VDAVQFFDRQGNILPSIEARSCLRLPNGLQSPGAAQTARPDAYHQNPKHTHPPWTACHCHYLSTFKPWRTHGKVTILSSSCIYFTSFDACNKQKTEQGKESGLGNNRFMQNNDEPWKKVGQR
jgi:hypothetical protein